ncbi:hypothetical protein [Bifidobacterium xylocopae]|uniref:Uncharacterized protein n=1 Tax=Bifidobacterium xylocopae TaxID=2493119 RepID=A0A366KAP7_9BIFI|nr:hypothetical protein [Bifidobacterium xylocopae]RBP98806.1 hypothetical protein CRD59_07070 [Bifidobacterium xylocopae]
MPGVSATEQYIEQRRSELAALKKDLDVLGKQLEQIRGASRVASEKMGALKEKHHLSEAEIAKLFALSPGMKSLLREAGKQSTVARP